MEKAKFTTLDGLRGFAALAVMGMHYSDQPIMLGGTNFFPNGDLAVDMFFALSGFVIAYAYDRRFAAGMTTSRFMLGRAIRLYPLYLIGTLLPAAMMLFLRWRGYYAHPGSLAGTLTEIGLSVLFVPQVFISAYYPLNSPAWSLLFEVIANWVYRVLFRRLTRPALLVIIAISFIALWRFGPVEPEVGVNSILPDLARVGFSFFAGVLIFRFWNTTTLRPRVSPWLIILGLMALLRFRAGTASFLIAPVLVYLGACTEPSGWTRRIFAALGDMSYAVYMLHYPVLMLAVIILPKALPSVADFSPWTGFGVMAAVMGLALLLDRYYDRPVRGWLSGLAKPRQRLSPAVAFDSSGASM